MHHKLIKMFIVLIADNFPVRFKFDDIRNSFRSDGWECGQSITTVRGD